WSPTCFNHSRIVPSVTDSPISGMVIWTVVPVAISTYPTIALRLRIGASFCEALAHGDRGSAAAQILGLGLRGSAAAGGRAARGGGGHPRPPRLRAGGRRGARGTRVDRAPGAAAVAPAAPRRDLLGRAARTDHP